MNKKPVIIIIGLIGILLIFQTGVFRNSNSDILQFMNKVFVGNKMIVKTSEDIQEEKIRINIISSDKVVFNNKKFLDNIGDVYGGPNFDVYYEDKLIGRALHHNTNDWYVNEFVFKFFSDNNQMKFTFETNGKSSGGEAGYIWINKINDTLKFESYKTSGKLINKWTE